MSAAVIELEHGTGGGMSRELIEGVIAPRLGTAHAGCMEDSAILGLQFTSIAMTTDSFVIDPIFFTGGDIGKLAVCGTVNDLAVSGATPRYITLSLVLEEGLPIDDLTRVLDSVRETAIAAEVAVVAGDTKVVRSGQLDKLFINTSGVGELGRELRLGAARVRPGDAVIVTGWLGNHSIHILSLREGLGFEQQVLSDCAALDGLVWNVLEEFAPHVHCMRDITRGGLGTVLNELAAAANVSIQVDEGHLPIQPETAMAADMLGLNPLYLANEGNICMLVDGELAQEILELVHWEPRGRHGQIVGRVRERAGSAVTLRRRDGSESVLEMLYGAQLPRLC
jgi:hydrogenase expression/formation protein HypE